MKISNADEAFSYIESFTNLEKKTSLYEREYRLDRMKYLLTLFSSPHKSLDIIHIAGSKGKGSTAAFTASILTGLGFKTGLYASPHIETYRERITLSGVFFNDSLYVSAVNDIKSVLEKTELPYLTGPTTFELLTLLAFIVFRDAGCTWAVIETGIGGRLDATNLVEPVCSIITPVELEHQDILGNTLREIAFEKAGIIKKGRPVYSAWQKSAAEKVITDKAAEENSSLFFLKNHAEIRDLSVTLGGTSFKAVFRNLEFSLSIKMTGGFQAQNALLALFAVYNTAVENNFYPGDSRFAAAAEKALSNVKLPGRLEYFPASHLYPQIILDSSHTLQSAEMLSETLSRLFTGKGIMIFGSVSGKNHAGMLDRLAGNFSRIIVCRPGTFKESFPEKIYTDFRKSRPEFDIIYEEDINKALQTASESAGKEGCIVVCGSFYLVSDARKIIKKQERPVEYFFNNRIAVMTGDITMLKADAVVNAANSSLMGGGGVDGAIHRAGGPSILEECRKIIKKLNYPAGLPAGCAVITGAGSLPADKIIHTVGPVWEGGDKGEKKILENAYKNSLKLAAENSIKTIAFPAISTGVYRYPKEKAAETAYSTVRSFLENNELPEKVIFIFFSIEDCSTFINTVRNL